MTLNRRKLLGLIGAGTLMSGCRYLRIDPWSPYLRSDHIQSPEAEQRVLNKASLSWTDDRRIRVLKVSGTPYEMGYQHGALMREQVRDNLEYMMEQVLDVYYFEEFFQESYERMRPFIPEAYVEEMHGLAHGAKIPLSMVHAIHALPEMSEWGGKKEVKRILKRMMNGDIPPDLGTSCSNISVTPNGTHDKKMYTVRVLDWGLHKVSKLHEYPLITVVQPTHGIPYAIVGWVGFLGAVSGMNALGITLGEMGYGDPAGETLRGTPMIFLLRDVLRNSNNLDEVREVISGAPGTNSYVYLMSDGRSGEAQMYIRDRNRFIVAEPGEAVRDGDTTLPALPHLVYGGHYKEKMPGVLKQYEGELSPEVLMEKVIPQIAMKSNFHNVVYSPSELLMWISNAKNAKTPAFTQPYTKFDLKKWL